MLSKIQEAESNSVNFQKETIEEFKKEMEVIEERKKKESDPNGLLALEEDFFKKSFKRQLEVSENALKTIIEMFKSQMK